MTDLFSATANLLRQDPLRMQCLQAAQKLNLPDWYLGAGFLRNAIWDHLHHKTTPTPLNDVDLVYFNTQETSKQQEQQAVKILSEICPEVMWDVKNQARMHLKHDHQPYKNTEDGISRWMEVPTCVGVKLTHDNQFLFTAPFGLQENWSLIIRINPNYPQPELYQTRLIQKGWQKTWPKLCCIGGDNT